MSDGFKSGGQLLNRVGEKDVIKIDNIESLYKTRSVYDVTKTKTKTIDDKNVSDKGVSTSTSAKHVEKAQKGIVNEKDVKNTPDEPKEQANRVEDSVKEDTELEKLVKSDEYKNFVSKELEEQCKLELKEDEYTCKYGSTEEITDDMMQKGVNDLELLRKIKGKGKQSYYITVTKNLQQAVDEALENERSLLKMLFEGIDETEDLIEAEEKNTDAKVVDSNIDSINLTGDQQQDAKIKDESKRKIKIILKKDKIEE